MTASIAGADDAPRLDPVEIARATASLAEHFQRLGMHLGPKATDSGVAHWADQFAGSVPIDVGSPTLPPPNDQQELAPAKQAAQTTPRVKSASSPETASWTRQPSSRLATVNPVTAGTANYAGPSLPVLERQTRLDELANVVANCTRCELLAKCRTQTVFGEGNVSPRVVFIGEGPGAEEDRTGRPFVGAAGQLLTKMIEACTFARSDVYILNTVKCRPPGNRNPEPGEIQNCREYLTEQLEILRPEYIVCLGAISSQSLLASTLSVGRLRGKFHQYASSKVVVTYHPAYLLRNPDAKKAAWEDLQMMLRDMGIAPKRS